MGKDKKNISRRKFLLATGGATIFVSGYYLLPSIITKNGKITPDRELIEKKIDLWVRLISDGSVIIYAPAAEMGQGSMTAIPVLLAEEMDADWSKVTVVSSPVDAQKYGIGWYPGGTKSMITAGSRTVRSFYRPMREAGALIRQALLINAAEKWQVNSNELTTEPGLVIHKKSNRKMSFGEIAEFGNFETLPDPSGVVLKDPKDFRLIGKIMPRTDIPLKTNGSATYGIDVQLPQMMYGFVNRSPVHGSKPQLTNETEIKQIEGVQAIVKLNHGIGVVASSIESGMQAKLQMQINWEDAPASAHNSTEDMASYSRKGEIERSKDGDVSSAFRTSEKTYEATYTNAYVYHAQMEPLNAVVSISPDKQSAEVWIGSQAPDSAQVAVAEILKTDPKNVKVNQLFLGGGFGRRTLTGFVTECAHLAMSVNIPVKLIWTREDDVMYGAFRPQVKHFIKAGVNKAGKIMAWSHSAIGPGGGLSDGGSGISHYDIPNRVFNRKEVNHEIRTKHWRSVGHGPNKFAIEAFIDQIARTQNKDPYSYRLEMMQGNERARRVLERAAELSNWNPVPKDDMAMGMALTDRDSFTCGVAQISLNRETGVIRVHNYWCALDSGIVVQPDNAIAQAEGAIMMGISSSLKEHIDFNEGEVVQSNFHDYPILRMSEAPESIKVAFIDSEEAPEGLGEAALPPVGGAIASAFAALTGKYLYDMPFTPGKVLEVLNT